MTDEDISIQKEAVIKINMALDELAETRDRSCPENLCPWILFTLRNTEYAVDARRVQRVAILYEIVPYTDAPAYCPGVIWDRSGMIRLLDLSAIFGYGDYLSSVKKGNTCLPMLVIIEPDGKRRGIIVDKIVMLGYISSSIEPLTSKDVEQSRHVQGTILYDVQKAPALVLSPESFSSHEFEEQGVKVDWKGRIDIRIKDTEP